MVDTRLPLTGTSSFSHSFSGDESCRMTSYFTKGMTSYFTKGMRSLNSTSVLRGMSRHKWLIVSGCLIGGLVIVFLGDATRSWAFGMFSVAIDQRLEKACHRAVAKRAPLGHRDIETTVYDDEGDDVAIAEGVMMARHDPSTWIKVAWTCHIKPKSGFIVHSEVKAASGRQKAFFK